MNAREQIVKINAMTTFKEVSEVLKEERQRKKPRTTVLGACYAQIQELTIDYDYVDSVSITDTVVVDTISKCLDDSYKRILEGLEVGDEELFVKSLDFALDSNRTEAAHALIELRSVLTSGGTITDEVNEAYNSARKELGILSSDFTPASNQSKSETEAAKKKAEEEAEKKAAAKKKADEEEERRIASEEGRKSAIEENKAAAKKKSDEEAAKKKAEAKAKAKLSPSKQLEQKVLDFKAKISSSTRAANIEPFAKEWFGDGLIEFKLSKEKATWGQCTLKVALKTKKGKASIRFTVWGV